MTPFPLTLADVKTQALKAHAEGRLCAQTQRAAFDPNTANAYYISHAYPGTGCAIGVALPPDVAHALQAKSDYRISANLNLVTIDPDELPLMTAIQDAHDHWASYAEAQPSPPEQAQREEAKFLELLQ